MLRRDPNYSRVRAGGRDITGRASYWLAADHLLVVREEGFSERYRRFFHRDVQALVIRRTRTRTILAIVFGLVAMVPTSMVLAGLVEALNQPLSPEDVVGFTILAIVAIALWVVFAVNLVSGPTCECFISTAVQSERLPGLGRVKRAHRLIASMTPLISRAQSDMPQNPVPPPPLPALVPEPATFAPALQPALPVIVRHYHGTLHAVGLALVILDGALGLLRIVTRLEIFGTINMWETFLEWGFLIAALIRQRRTDIPRRVKACAWTVLIYYAAEFVIMAPLMALLGSGGRKGPAGPTLTENPGMFAFDVASNSFLLIVGIWGIHALLKFRREYLPPAPPPLPSVAPTTPIADEFAPPPQSPPAPGA